eukprot:scaffold96133_cov13-Tisochrysis_lutea.AAC.1
MHYCISFQLHCAVLNQLPIDEAEIEGGGFLHGSEQLSIEIARPPIETFSFDIVVAQLRPQEGLRWVGRITDFPSDHALMPLRSTDAPSRVLHAMKCS